MGYKVHLTETCEEERPRIIPEVRTTLTPIADGEMTTPIHQELQAKDLLPADHLVDTAYLDAELLVTSQETYGVNLVGPIRVDTGWQARQAKGGLGATAGHLPSWKNKPILVTGQRHARQCHPPHPLFQKDCGQCPLRPQGTHSQPPRRTVTVRPYAQQLALQAAREREKTEAFKQQYAHRAGMEGTFSLRVRAFVLRRTRYLWPAKTHLQHILVAGGINLARLVRWIKGEVPSQAHVTAFTRLFQANPV